MPQIRTLCFLIFAGITLSISLNDCAEKQAVTLRTDVEPLTKRLKLPGPIRAVRWVAVSPVHDTGWIPPKAEFYHVYAYIELDAGAWNQLAGFAGPSSGDTITIPESVARELLPPAAMEEFKKLNDSRTASGSGFNSDVLAAEERTRVDKAVRVGDALVVMMTTH
jgi:hypothetical protein